MPQNLYYEAGINVPSGILNESVQFHQKGGLELVIEIVIEAGKVTSFGWIENGFSTGHISLEKDSSPYHVFGCFAERVVTNDGLYHEQTRKLSDEEFNLIHNHKYDPRVQQILDLAYVKIDPLSMQELSRLQIKKMEQHTLGDIDYHGGRLGSKEEITALFEK